MEPEQPVDAAEAKLANARWLGLGSHSFRGLVRKAGLEPARLAAPVPKTGASTSSATFASAKHPAPGRRKQGSRTRSAGNKNARPGPGVLRIGGPSRIRTLDLLIKSQLLYQLS